MQKSLSLFSAAEAALGLEPRVQRSGTWGLEDITHSSSRGSGDRNKNITRSASRAGSPLTAAAGSGKKSPLRFYPARAADPAAVGDPAIFILIHEFKNATNERK